MAIERKEKEDILTNVIVLSLNDLISINNKLRQPDKPVKISELIGKDTTKEEKNSSKKNSGVVLSGTVSERTGRDNQKIAYEPWQPRTVKRRPRPELHDLDWLKDRETASLGRPQKEGEPGDYKLCQLTAFGPDGDVVPIANGDGTTVELSKLLNHNGDRASEVLPERIIFSNEEPGGQDVRAKEQQIFVDKNESNNNTVDNTDHDFDIITGQDTPRRDEDVSPLQGGITTTTKKEPPFSEITDEVSLDELNPTAPQAPVLEVNSVTPVKNVERVVLEQDVEDPLVVEDNDSKQLHERLNQAHKDESLGSDDSQPEAIAAVPNSNPAVDFVDPRITVDNTTESLAPDSQPIIGQTTEPTLEQSGLDNMPDNSAGQLSSAQFQQTQEIIGGNSQDIQAEAVGEPAPEQVLDLKVAIPPATEISPDNQDASLTQDPVSAQAEPQIAETGPEEEVITDTAPQLPVEPAQTEQVSESLNVQSHEADETKSPSEEKVVIEQNSPVVENVNNTQPEAAEDTTITAGNIEDVEPASGALNDPNIFVDTNYNSNQTNHGFFASFADKFLHGNKKGRVMRRVAREKDASLDARIFADQGHHVENDDEILEKAA